MIGWLALSLVLGAVTYLAAWSRLPTKARGLTVLAFALALPASGALLLTNRGWPAELVPYITTIPDGEHSVLGVKLLPEVAIFLMLDIEGNPRLFQLPWNAEQASRLQRMQEEGNGDVKARKKGKSEDDDYPLMFHAQPQAATPDKQPEQPGMTYERQS